MKYKDYKNPHTNDNRIYSYSEIFNMPLGEILKNKDELVAQYRVLGVPQEKELAGSENVIRVEAYTRSDGTEVKAHWRSRGKYGKANPESSKQEGGKSEGGKSDDVQNEPSTPDTKEKQEERGMETSNYKTSNTQQKIDNIVVKEGYEINKLQEKLIDFNNNQNANYKDARECMNISIIGPENILNCSEYQILDKNQAEEIAAQTGINVSDNIKTVKYDSESSLAKSVNNSEELKKQINENISKIEKNEKLEVSFNEDTNLFRSLHNATIVESKIENGVLTGYLYDRYDFEYQIYNKNLKDSFKNIKENAKTTVMNNSATLLQNSGQLKNYNILVPIKMKL